MPSATPTLQASGAPLDGASRVGDAVGGGTGDAPEDGEGLTPQWSIGQEGTNKEHLTFSRTAHTLPPWTEKRNVWLVGLRLSGFPSGQGVLYRRKRLLVDCRSESSTRKRVTDF